MPTTLKEALNLDDGMPVTGLRATIKVAFESKSGEKGGTEWCFVPMILIDDAKNEMSATWFDPATTDYKSLKGRPVEISARKNKKNQLAGAKVSHRMVKDQPTVGLTISGDHLRFTDEAQETTSAPQGASAASNKAPAHSGVVSQPRGAQGAPGRPTDLDLIAAVGRWTKGLREAIDPINPDNVQHAILQPLLSTFLIAATSDRSSMTIVPPGHVPAHVEKPDTRGDNLTDDDPGPTDPGDDDIPF